MSEMSNLKYKDIIVERGSLLFRCLTMIMFEARSTHLTSVLWQYGIVVNLIGLAFLTDASFGEIHSLANKNVHLCTRGLPNVAKYMDSQIKIQTYHKYHVHYIAQSNHQQQTNDALFIRNNINTKFNFLSNMDDTAAELG